MRGNWGIAAAGTVALLVGAGRAQGIDPVGGLPGGGVVRPPRVGVSLEAYRMPAATTYGVLDEMASRASVIFVGRVTDVVWGDGGNTGSAGVVAIEFAVEDGVLGVAAGTTYVMKEWAGLWRDAPRYSVGQRRLMLLHAAGPGGLSSPVDGLDGAIPVVGGEAPSEASAAGAAAAPAWRADLRWVQAKQMRTMAVAGRAAAEPLGGERALAGSAAAVGPLPVEGNPTLAEVVGRLRVGESHAAR